MCCVLCAVCCVLAFRQLFFAPGDYSASFTVWIMDDSCYEEESEYVDLTAPTALHPHVRIAHPHHPKPHAACGHVHAERLAYMRAPSRTTVPFVWLRVRTHTERLVYMPPRITARSPQPHFCLTRPVLVFCCTPPPTLAALLFRYFVVSLYVPGGGALLGEGYSATVRIDDDDFGKGRSTCLSPR